MTAVFEVVRASAERAEKLESLVTELVYATGPVTYGYQFADRRAFFDDFVAASWRAAGSLFAWDIATLALAGGELAGLELGFVGREFYIRKDALAGVTRALLADGRTTVAEVQSLAVRADKASYLNAHIPDDVYYVLALSVRESQRGRGVGARLLRNAMEAARGAGLRALELDVLADNPAVRFYESMGLEVVAETRSPELTRDHGFSAELRLRIGL